MMDNFQATKNELLDAVREPERKRKPSNWGLYLALGFFNAVLLAIDIISGVTVYRMTGIVAYGVLTILAGAIPLGLSEILYTRPFASPAQRWIAGAQAVIAFASILTVGVYAAIGNVQGWTITEQDMELTMLIVIVSVALLHAILAGAYFYSDDGIIADQRLNRSIAGSKRKEQRLAAADQILKIVDSTVARRKEIGAKYRGGTAAIMEVLKQLGEDADNDGIPDVLESHGRKQSAPALPDVAYAEDTEAATAPRPLSRKERK